jgi:rod shape-determining protein MreC
VHSANFISGNFYTLKSNITSYFFLKQENKKLVEENSRLHTLLGNSEIINTLPEKDNYLTKSSFQYFTAKIINNNYSKTKNNLTINVGENDSIKMDMGVISSKGIVGIVNNVSNLFATIQSILNTQSQINAKLKKSNHFGSLVWDGKNPNIAQLIEIPRLAPIVEGDTIVTGGKSTIFPEGIPVGFIKDFTPTQDQNSYILNIQLFNDMTQLEAVYIIKNNNRTEILQLEKETEDAE